ncbi:MAG: hypothetical protein HUU35_07550 [Armatimonadetes bacterium]|nr:hypothetical protein [Armatimonadota bacterium]
MPDRGRDTGAFVSRRAVLLGLLLLPLNAFWLIQIEYVRYSDTPTIPQLFFHCIAALVLLTGANRLLGRLRPAMAFSQGELLTVYAMLVVGSNVAGHDQLQILFTTIVYVFGRATPENQWAATIHPHLRRRLVVSDQAALDDLFRGHSSLYTPEHLGAWAAPLLVWGLLALLVAATLYCAASLLRRQWDHERLTYPLAEVPLNLSGPDLAIYRDPIFLAGAGLAAGLQLLNLAHQLWPGAPSVKIGVTLTSFSQPPWRYMGPVPICFYPFAFGLAFLLPTNLGFSCFFFFLLTRLERVLAGMAGFTDWNGFPYVEQQASGAFVGFGLFALWAARDHLLQSLRVAAGREPDGDRGEPLPYRLAWAGFLLGSALLIAFTVLIGMRWPVALLFWALLLLIILAVARVRAEVGLPSIELFHRGADDMLRRAGGTAFYKPAELAALSLFYWLNRTQRNYNLQHQLHALRLAARAGLNLPRFSGVVALATVVGVLVGLWAMLHITYQVGLEGGRFAGPAPGSFGNDPWLRLGRALLNPEKSVRGGTIAYFFGAAVCGLLVVARTKLAWWPLHPAGWVAANSFALLRLWVPLTLTWVAKSLILRYGGLRLYRRALPFFIGLVTGEFTAGLLRTLVDLAWGLYLPAGSGIGGL